MLAVSVLIIGAVIVGLMLVITKQLRDEIQQATLRQGSQSIATMVDHLNRQHHIIEVFSNQMAALTTTIERKLSDIQTDTASKLELVRLTVDEKLQNTLEKRLGETYQLMSERLEQVHKGLGEMQHLAQGVGDLRRVLTNVKTRGTWGEIQLGALLEQVMTPDQYSKNVKIIPSSADNIEYAIRLPGTSKNEVVWLPIDSKFPQDAYHRVVTAIDTGEKEAVDEAKKHLEIALKTQAKLISQKYIHPPYSTDFAIMFLPTEGLFSEALRLDGLHDILQTQFRVIIAGPTTLTAIMSSLQLGFKTLAIQKRTGEVWQLLTVIQAEFGKFGTLLEKTQKKLVEAGQTIEDATRKTRTIERRLDKLSSQYDGESTEISAIHLFEFKETKEA